MKPGDIGPLLAQAEQRDKQMPGSPWTLKADANGSLWVYYEAGGNRLANDADVWAAARIAELEAALREISEVADEGLADAKSSCRTEAKAIAFAARQVLKQ